MVEAGIPQAQEDVCSEDKYSSFLATELSDHHSKVKGEPIILAPGQGTGLEWII